MVEYSPDGGLRDTEQISIVGEDSIADFLKREVLPYTPRYLVRSKQRQERLREKLHPLLLQAAAAASTSGNIDRDSSLGAGGRGLLDGIIGDIGRRERMVV